MIRQSILAIVVCLVAATSCSADNRLPGPVAVELTDGRVVKGRVDQRSDDSTLRLTLVTPRIRVTTPIDWQYVKTVSANDRSFSREEFSATWKRFAVETSVPARSAELRSKVSPKPSPAGRSQVKAIAADARLGHWNSRPDADGLLLNFAVLDSEGGSVVAAGQLDVQLVGLRQGVRGGRATLGKKPDLLMLERWGQSIRTTDFQDGTVQVRLPFRRLRPQQAIDVADGAFLRVRFGVPSQGVLEVSLPDVLIREFSPFRDELYHAAGSRLLPFERP